LIDAPAHDAIHDVLTPTYPPPPCAEVALRTDYILGSTQTMSKKIKKPTPCTGMCTLDEDLEICLSCSRTIHEIAVWGDLTLAEATQMMEVVQARQKLLWALWDDPEGFTVH